MTSTQKGSEILKTDKRGRVKTTPERRQELLEEFDKSGLSAPKYAALTGLKYQTFAGWLIQRRKQRDGMAPAVLPDKQPTVQWLETVIEKAQSTQAVPTSNLVVRLPSGAMIEVVTAAQAALVGEVLRSWEKAGAC
jgi:hypothetical protein